MARSKEFEANLVACFYENGNYGIAFNITASSSSALMIDKSMKIDSKILFKLIKYLIATNFSGAC